MTTGPEKKFVMLVNSPNDVSRELIERVGDVSDIRSVCWELCTLIEKIESGKYISPQQFIIFIAGDIFGTGDLI